MLPEAVICTFCGVFRAHYFLILSRMSCCITGGGCKLVYWSIQFGRILYYFKRMSFSSFVQCLEHRIIIIIIKIMIANGKTSVRGSSVCACTQSCFCDEGWILYIIHIILYSERSDCRYNFYSSNSLTPCDLS